MKLNSSIWAIDVALAGTTTPGKSWPGSNDNGGVLHISQITWIEALSSDSLLS